MADNYAVGVKFAKVATNLLDLWMEPKYQSERASQLFYNEPLEVLEKNNGFLKVVQADGYTGWADERFLITTSESEFKKYGGSNNLIVSASQAVLTDKKKESIPPHFLYYGTHIKGTKSGAGSVSFTQPNGEKAYIKPQNLKPITKKKKVTGRLIVKEAARWLGVPYLWGGMTPAGFDCSGFVKMIFAQYNVGLPRDTKDQINFGQEIERSSIKTGDLIFFKRHVGIAITRSRIIHCSVGSNGVRFESIEKGEKNYRSDLDANYIITRRVI